MRPVSVLSWLALPLAALAGVKEVWWNITYVDNVNPDGMFPRRVIGVNNTWPPPPMEVNGGGASNFNGSTNGDSLLVHVTNSLDEPTSLHHHGMFFNSTSWMDGAVGVTECGIPPGGSASYVIPTNSSGQWGTYWVHAHASGQYVNGLRAPFLIHPPALQEPYRANSSAKTSSKYDDEFTVILGDWYHDEHKPLRDKFMSISNPGGAEPVPDSALIYFSHNASYLSPISSSSPSSGSAVGFNENTTLPFEAGKTYRLRIINTSAFAMFWFWIDGHEMRVIEVDGTDTEESPMDLLALTVAQRYSVLITARNDTSSNWAIHANMDIDMFDVVPDGLMPNISSSITYSPNANITDLGFIDEYTDVNDTAFVPFEAIKPPAPTKTIELEVIFDTVDDGTNHAMFNQITYNYPVVPGIFSALSLANASSSVTNGLRVAENEQAYGPSSFVIAHGEVVDLVVKNGDAGKHPFHLHGHKFFIVHRASDYTSDDPELNPPLVEGQENPIRRDTVQIQSMGSATLRVVADNPGVWLFHCHIEWHLESGLALQLIEAPILAQQRASPTNADYPSVPKNMYDNCAALNILTSGNAAGHPPDADGVGVGDLSGLRTGPFPQRLGWRPKGIGAMFGCVLSAVLGTLSIIWYSYGGEPISEEEMEREAREQLSSSASGGKRFGFLRARV